MYPVVFTEYSDASRSERGFGPSYDETIKIQFSNGTVAPIASAIDENIEVVGFKFVSFKHKDALKYHETQVLSHETRGHFFNHNASAILPIPVN